MRRSVLCLLAGVAATVLLPICAQADDACDFCQIMVSAVWSFKERDMTVAAEICETLNKHTELCNKIVANQDKIVKPTTEDCKQECVCQEMFETCNKASGQSADEKEDSAHADFFSSLKWLLKWLFQGNTPLHVVVSTINTILKAVFPKFTVAIKLAQPLVYKLAEAWKSMTPEKVDKVIDDAVNQIKATFSWFTSLEGTDSNTAHNNEGETGRFSFQTGEKTIRDDTVGVPSEDNFTEHK